MRNKASLRSGCIAAAVSTVGFFGSVAFAPAQIGPPYQRFGVDRPRGAPHPEIIYPDTDIPLPEGFTMTRVFMRRSGETVRTSPDPAMMNLPRDVPERLAACWTPPLPGKGQEGQITVRLSFRRDGVVIGRPATPFTQGTAEADRVALRDSLLSAIGACTPLRFTTSLGKAIAGRIFAIRFVVRSTAFDERS